MGQFFNNFIKSQKYEEIIAKFVKKVFYIAHYIKLIAIYNLTFGKCNEKIDLMLLDSREMGA
ncbi:MAG: hypothetical protein ACFFCM_10920 [Promethearchaeota archaeon]